MKTALVTGVTGQDGAYLSAFLLSKGYRVIATYRRTASQNFWRIEELGVRDKPNLKLVELDITDASSVIRVIGQYRPEEVYNLAAQSFVGLSFEQPLSTSQITGLGALNLLEAIRIVDKNIKFYQASTSEMFGLVQQVPQSEATPFYPRSPYGVAKLYAHWMVVNYRESYDMFTASGILFNHESPLRGLEFVTRKISNAVAQIALGKADTLALGNLDAKRDWGHAKDYVEGMWAMLQADRADTYVLATGRTESVREFVTMAFRAVDVELAWEGSGVDEVGYDVATGERRVTVDPGYYRPAEVDLLVGDASKAERELGWRARVSLEDLCASMVNEDIRRNECGKVF